MTAGMQAYALTRFGLAGLEPVTRPLPVPGPGEARVRIAAVSLNRRDLLLVEGSYNPKQKLPIIPCSDAAGTVEAVGPGVSTVKPGDRVVIGFFPGWLGGEPTAAKLATAWGGPGGDGLLASHALVPAAALAPLPAHLDEAEGACFPCAGATAWSAIVTLGRVQPGETVLVQGTGGVSIFALQFAKLAGARVIATSSSDDKLAFARSLGADATINYRTDKAWPQTARDLANGRIDHIVDVGGAETLEGALRAIRPGGTISLIGVLGGAVAPLNLPLAVMRQVRLQGVTVADQEGLAAMLRAVAASGLRPVIGARFSFSDTPAAFAAMAENRVAGKIVITL